MRLSGLEELSQFNPYLLVGGAFLIGVVPIFLGIATAYLKVSIVFGMVRNALGGQQVPGPLVTGAISAAVTALIMGPVFEESMTRLEALQLKKMTSRSIKEIGVVLRDIGEPWQRFLKQHAGATEVKTLQRLSRAKHRDSASVPEPSVGVLLGAFMLSELRESFLMACVVLTPFVVVDLVVANLLVGLGMFMVSPVLITLPLKLAIFCAIDGWLRITEALVRSYGYGSPG